MQRLVFFAVAAGSIAVLRRPASREGSRPARTQTVWDSVYTDSQATRGDTLYRTMCAKCHGVALKGGDDGTPLTGDPFFLTWEGKPLGELYDRIRNSMPPDNPKSIPRSQVPDIMAYLLAQNRFPAGAKPLTDDGDRLKDITLAQNKP